MHHRDKLELGISAMTHRNLKTVLITMATMVTIGIAYILVVWDYHPHAVIVGAVDGCIIGLASALAEIYFFNTTCRRIKFFHLLLLRTVFYVILISGPIIAVGSFHISLMSGTSFASAFEQKDFHEYLTGGKLLRDVVFVFAIVCTIN